MTTRLHITPLDPPLLQAILHGQQPINASFHTIPTFPENNYGFITLPTADAEKVMKKYNGAILKGKKLKVQEAVPEVRRSPDPETKTQAAAAAEEKEDKDKKKKEKKEKKENKKKRKASENVVDGYELPSDRHVKRGWTDASPPKRSRKDKEGNKDKKEKSKKQQSASKYSDKPECLFQAKLPANKVTATEEAKHAVEKAKKKKKSKKDPHNVVTVHEFENVVTHPSFIRTSEGAEKEKLTGEFVEGKGWVDREGNVKETEPDEKKKKPKEIKGEKLGKDYVEKWRRSKEEKKEKKEKKEEKKKQRAPTPPPEDDDYTSSSGSSSEESESEAEEEESDKEETPVLDAKGDTNVNTGDPMEEDQESSEADDISSTASSSSSSSSSVTSPRTPEKPLSSAPSQQQEEQHEPHPLELLFKKPAKLPTQSATAPTTSNTNNTSTEAPTEDAPFTFFGNADNDDIDETASTVGVEGTSTLPDEPFTPFTQDELLARRIRSGAPTPETVRRDRSESQRSFAEEEQGDWDEEDDEDIGGWGRYDTPSRVAQKKNRKGEAGVTEETDAGNENAKDGEGAESEFAKWFWENRGDNNRTWKRRRREAAKEKRQRENRARGMKGRF